jgi:hypothetical protein
VKRVTCAFVVVLALLTACSGSPGASATAMVTSVADQGATAGAPVESNGAPVGQAPSGLPADVETYYKTMVFIEGTGQLLGKLDLTEAMSSGNQAAFMPLITMPGVMDDKLIQAEQTPVPDPLAESWDKAAQAEAGMTQALETLLSTFSQEDFDRDVAANTSLASESVKEAEAVLASEYGADPDTIAAAHKAALTEMGETYKTFVSFLQVGQSQTDDGSN